MFEQSTLPFAALLPIGIGVFAMLVGIVLRVVATRLAVRRPNLEATGGVLMVAGALFALFSLGAALL